MLRLNPRSTATIAVIFMLRYTVTTSLQRDDLNPEIIILIN
jgi:lipoate synthase